MAESDRIAVLGAGNWGTTLAYILSQRGYRIGLWEYREDLARDLAALRENRIYLPGVILPPEVDVTPSLGQALQKAAVCLFALPSQSLREACQQAAPFITPHQLVISCVKGLEHHTRLRMSQVIEEVLGRQKIRLAVLSGPNIAGEIARGMPATSVAAALDPNDALAVQRIFHSKNFRIYTSGDVVGVELGGALKNIIAIASGMVDGLGLGANTKGALITRGLAEIIRLGTALGANQETFYGLSGLGDLVTTCMSRQSRNWNVGYRLGQGERWDDIQRSLTMVAEGVPTAESALRLAEDEGIEMPISRAVYQIIFENKDPRQAMEELMTREAKPE